MPRQARRATWRTSDREIEASVNEGDWGGLPSGPSPRRQARFEATAHCREAPEMDAGQKTEVYRVDAQHGGPGRSRSRRHAACSPQLGSA